MRLNPYRVSETTDIQEGWRITEAVLVEMNRLCREYGTRLLVLYIPCALEVVPREIERQALQAGVIDSPTAFDPGLPEKRLRQIAQTNGIPMIPMDDRFRQDDATALFLAHLSIDGHLNAQGHTLVAGALAEFPSEKGWLPEADFRFEPLQSAR